MDKNSLHLSRANLAKVDRPSHSNMTINSNLPVNFNYKNGLKSPKNIVMIDPGYLQRNSHEFSSSLNLTAFKSSTVDNSIPKENSIFRSYSTSVIQVLNCKTNQSANDTNQSSRIIKQKDTHNEKKRNAASLDEVCNTYQNPTTRARLAPGPSSFNLETKH